MRIAAFLTVLIAFPIVSNAQVSKHKKKHSTDAGSFFFNWGYNRSYYTKSDIRFVGSAYDFKLKNVVATDRPDKFDPKLYFNPTTLTIPQYNWRIGYYIQNRWAVSFGVDHYKYVMANHNEVLLDGHIDQGIDDNWGGNYYDEPVVTNTDTFHYENTNGVNILRFELMRSFDVWEYGAKRQIAVTANIGAGAGPVLTFSDLNFARQHTFATPSISGFALALHGSVRLEFFKHFFVSVESGLAYVNLPHVRTRSDDRNQFARQQYGLSLYYATLGGILYFRSKNGCDSCPHW